LQPAGHGRKSHRKQITRKVVHAFSEREEIMAFAFLVAPVIENDRDF
jgi:hypothetical protein